MNSHKLCDRFRGYLPVVVDIETAGLNPQTDAVLEIAAITLKMDEKVKLYRDQLFHCHVLPFEGANLDEDALKINGIDPGHPFRDALSEKDALNNIFNPIFQEIEQQKCQRAVLVGHNAWFDLHFLQAAVKRVGDIKNPFHSFTSFDTATLSSIMLGHNVLAVACEKAGIPFNTNEAHSAIYDAEKTADLFCYLVNRWQTLTNK